MLEFDGDAKNVAFKAKAEAWTFEAKAKTIKFDLEELRGQGLVLRTTSVDTTFTRATNGQTDERVKLLLGLYTVRCIVTRGKSHQKLVIVVIAFISCVESE